MNIILIILIIKHIHIQLNKLQQDLLIELMLMLFTIIWHFYSFIKHFMVYLMLNLHINHQLEHNNVCLLIIQHIIKLKLN